jgi:hypothetical protein
MQRLQDALVTSLVEAGLPPRNHPDLMSRLQE